MQLTEAQFELISDLLPDYKGNIRLQNLQVINAILYVATSGCQWRALPQRYGKWNTVYTRMMRWSRMGILDRVFERLQREQIIRVHIEVTSRDRDRERPSREYAGMPQQDAINVSNVVENTGRPRYIWLPRMAGALRLP